MANKKFCRRHVARSIAVSGLVFSFWGTAAFPADISEVRQPPRYKWKEFTKVSGQPEPVPVEWVSTLEGKFAHSIVIPNPVPEDSGYRWWWSAKRYHQHLCEKEAGEFIFKSVYNVKGLLFMRPPLRPTDYDLKDARKLEAPGLERGFGSRNHIGERGSAFVWRNGYEYVEEPSESTESSREGYFRASGPLVKPHFWLRDIKHDSNASSRYGVTWRGVLRHKDREHMISGHEIIVLDLHANQVVGVLRDFYITGFTSNTRDGVWWLNAPSCQIFPKTYAFAGKQHLVDFVTKVIVPVKAVK